jgi:hypothetical protein
VKRLRLLWKTAKLSEATQADRSSLQTSLPRMEKFRS